MSLSERFVRISQSTNQSCLSSREDEKMSERSMTIFNRMFLKRSNLDQRRDLKFIFRRPSQPAAAGGNFAGRFTNVKDIGHRSVTSMVGLFCCFHLATTCAPISG